MEYTPLKREYKVIKEPYQSGPANDRLYAIEVESNSLHVRNIKMKTGGMMDSWTYTRRDINEIWLDGELLAIDYMDGRCERYGAVYPNSEQLDPKSTRHLKRGCDMFFHNEAFRDFIGKTFPKIWNRLKQETGKYKPVNLKYWENCAKVTDFSVPQVKPSSRSELLSSARECFQKAVNLIILDESQNQDQLLRRALSIIEGADRYSTTVEEQVIKYQIMWLLEGRYDFKWMEETVALYEWETFAEMKKIGCWDIFTAFQDTANKSLTDEEMEAVKTYRKSSDDKSDYEKAGDLFVRNARLAIVIQSDYKARKWLTNAEKMYSRALELIDGFIALQRPDFTRFNSMSESMARLDSEDDYEEYAAIKKRLTGNILVYKKQVNALQAVCRMDEYSRKTKQGSLLEDLLDFYDNYINPPQKDYPQFSLHEEIEWVLILKWFLHTNFGITMGYTSGEILRRGLG